MLKIFYELDEMDNIEKNLMAEASNRLSVGEFQLFQLSYASWFGDDLDPALLEATFFAYLTNNDIPPWARHYARRIIAMDDEGSLDFRDPEYHRFDVASMRESGPKAGAVKVFAVLLFLLVFLGASMYLIKGSDPDDYRCRFPPCPWVR